MALGLVKLLIAEYVFIAIISLFEKDWPFAAYFIGAAILTVAIILMRQT